MKRNLGSMISSRGKKVACTVSAAALMLGVSSAATIGLHFQCNYGCGAFPPYVYAGYPVTLPAFGVPANQWENLIGVPNAYNNCTFTVPGYETNEVIDTTTSTNGLNPLPNGSLEVTWFANCANFDPFAGYGFPAPYYEEPGGYAGSASVATSPVSGEEQVYATFLRDGINYGPNTDGSPAPYGSADNPLEAYYSIDVTGLKSLFTNTPFVVELMASADSMNALTNAVVTDVLNGTSYMLPYPNTAPVNPQGGPPWVRGIGGGLSLSSGVFSNTDHLHIASAIPQHGGSDPGFDNAGTISGFIITDKPVVSMSPQSIPLAGPSDTIALSAYAIGVPPLSYQWQLNGKNIPGATTLTNTIAAFTLADAGNYTLVVTNLYGSATSKVATVTADLIVQTSAANIVYDSNPGTAQHDGVNMGATWAASSSDGTITRTGVMSFVAIETNGITVVDGVDFNGPTGTITLWMRSPGTDQSAPGDYEAALLARPGSIDGSADFMVSQDDTGVLDVQIPPNGGNAIQSTNQTVSDNKWHFVAVTFDQSANGGVAIYIDGTEYATNNNGGTSWSWPTSPLEIGYTTDPTWRDYNGVLDGIRYYSAILSPSQITSIFSSGNSDALVDPTALQLEFNFTTAPGSGTVLSWQETSAVLQVATDLSDGGNWVNVVGATSPYTIVPSEDQQFFRYSYTAQSLVSNPYLQ